MAKVKKTPRKRTAHKSTRKQTPNKMARKRTTTKKVKKTTIFPTLSKGIEPALMALQRATKKQVAVLTKQAKQLSIQVKKTSGKKAHAFMKALEAANDSLAKTKLQNLKFSHFQKMIKKFEKEWAEQNKSAKPKKTKPKKKASTAKKVARKRTERPSFEKSEHYEATNSRLPTQAEKVDFSPMGDREDLHQF